MRHKRPWLSLLLVLFFLSLSACDTTVVRNEFRCQNDDQCSNDKVCKEGQCVKDDKDGDGWSSKRDCDDNNKNVYPGSPEICDNKVDDNCNGTVDEKPCQCLENDERECGVSAVGICSKGVQRCEGGKWGKCLGGTDPATEDCNGKDDDCDGQTDEDLKGQCYSGPDGTQGRGECKGGTRSCSSGNWSTCSGEVTPQKETCDGKDNDCDGLVDNGLERDCYDGPANTQGRGECKGGKQTCDGGKWSECRGEIKPTTEDCNGKDDDCDGKVDNGLNSEACYLGPQATKDVGQCKAGVRSCDSDKGAWTQCLGQVLPAGKDTCSDGIDNNCNGTTDEGCQSFFAITQSINTDTGEIDGIKSPGWQGSGKFQLSNLRIPANKRVKVTGNHPLSLIVQGPVELLGTLDLAGGDGGSSNCTNNNPGPAGTAGGGGGSLGGKGSPCNVSGSQPPGDDGLGNGGGKGGKGGSQNGGGGGGAGHVDRGKDGLPSGFGGKGGLPSGSPTTLSPGSGGAGGACGQVGSSLFAVYTPAAGGGGGGGAVQIESTTGDLKLSGNIIANGGDGGAGAACTGGLTPGTAIGGGGGGGAGGYIWLRAKGKITIDPSAYLNASGGKGGGQPTAKGGDGSDGRIQLQDADGKVTVPSGRVTPTPSQTKY